ncbi:hypothetical protein RRG08_002955 [Elysia crispata]|uniref:Uncharacterized protein n=1 Tax=Elysia crispata TaxID=231223 RepID=A0AAE1APF4_9GAST|nr:hypothetical protein RRG08_002955 [Elysia crispata]
MRVRAISQFLQTEFGPSPISDGGAQGLKERDKVLPDINRYHLSASDMKPGVPDQWKMYSLRFPASPPTLGCDKCTPQWFVRSILQPLT